MSFDLPDPKSAGDLYHAPPAGAEDDFPNALGVHKDLFETLSEAHYLPELAGPHDEALLDSLVEKGCEDNQILGQALDKLAHLVHGSNDYAEEEDDMLLGGAPVADIIDRLEQSLESPGRNSITAAQGLLHLHHIGDHMQPDLENDQTYVNNEVYTTEPQVPECDMNINPVSELQHVNSGNLGYAVEDSLRDNVRSHEIMYTDVPESQGSYDNRPEEPQTQQLPDQSEPQVSSGMLDNVSEMCDQIKDKYENNVISESDQRTETIPEAVDFSKAMDEPENNDDLEPTDLSVKHVEKCVTPHVVATAAETTHMSEDSMSEKSDEQPKDLTVHRRVPSPHASPRRIEIPRPPSRESDAMQSPQPSGIPAVPSSPELFTMPTTKSKQTLFLETLLSSPSPKMYTSEVTITKQPCEPINLGKHRKSASPTVSSCSDDMRKLNKDYGEPQDKRVKRESVDDIVKISTVFSKSNDDQITDTKQRKPERPLKCSDETSPLKQLQVLKTSPEFNIPDPLLVPKDKLNLILAAPGREIPALLIQRPELRLPEAFAFPAILQDPDILVISLSQLENILENDAKKTSSKSKDSKSPSSKSSSSDTRNNSQSDQNSQPKPIPSIDALAGDIDAATSAAFNQMLWLPYLSQLEAMAACSQNMDFLKALNSSGYTGSGYPDLSQMFNPASNRFMGSSGFPMMPPMEYDNRLQLAMWQEAMNHANAQRSKSSSMESHMKELSKSSDLQNPYVHSTKSHQSKSQQSSSARTSPLVHNYGNQRSMNPNPFFAGMYPGMNPNMRPNVPLPGLQIPYLNPNLMNSQRSPRSAQQKSPTSPYYPNNNYLQSLKQSSSESHGRQRSSSTSSQESPKPRISVKSLQNLMEPGASGSSARRPSNPPATASSRRREEGEVGSTTPGEPPLMPPMPHDPASFHLWHPLFGNQKGYSSPWSWTTVTATGD